MKSENLRFMPGWDNSSRGNRYNENDFKRQPTEAERKVERDALTSREQVQRQQVLEHQQLEQKVLRELRDAIADLQAQQRLEQDELEAGFQAHLQELQDHQDKMRA